MELHHLRYFVEVARTCNYRQAALRLHVSQPAISRAVQQLEAELGLLLLERSRSGVRPTAAGLSVLERATSVLEAVDKLGEGLGGRLGSTLRLAHVLPEYFRAGPLARSVQAFRARHPEVSVDLRAMLHAQMLSELAFGRLDCGFAWLPLENVPKSLSVEVVVLEQPVIALPPGHAAGRKDAVRLSELRAETFLLFPRNAMPERFDEIRSMLVRGGIEPTIRALAPNLSVVLAAVGNGEGVSVVPRIAASVHARLGFTLHEIEGLSARWSLVRVAARKVCDPVLGEFLEALRKGESARDAEPFPSPDAQDAPASRRK